MSDPKPYYGPRRRGSPIGQELVIARNQEPPVDWKTLMARYGLGRTRLWMLWSAAKKDVHEHLSSSHSAENTPSVAGDAA